MALRDFKSHKNMAKLVWNLRKLISNLIEKNLGIECTLFSIIFIENTRKELHNVQIFIYVGFQRIVGFQKRMITTKTRLINTVIYKPRAGNLRNFSHYKP